MLHVNENNIIILLDMGMTATYDRVTAVRKGFAKSSVIPLAK